jgi:anti-sigma regulatory factor (Ser/Thr protein kinase)
VPPTSDQDRHAPRRADARPAPISDAASETLDLVLTADWVAPARVRARVREWLGAHRWPTAHVDELVLAISEAVSNSIEHGYGLRAESVARATDVVEVHSHIGVDVDGFRQAEFTIKDYGVWRIPSGRRTTRGRGMLIMRTCTDDVMVDFSDAGTTVMLLSHPVPPIFG